MSPRGGWNIALGPVHRAGSDDALRVLRCLRRGQRKSPLGNAAEWGASRFQFPWGAGLRRAWFGPGACRQLGGGVKGPSLVSPPATSRLGWSKKSLTEGGFRVIQSVKCRGEREGARLGRPGPLRAPAVMATVAVLVNRRRWPELR